MITEILLIAGGVTGFLFGLLALNRQAGGILLALVATGMIADVAVWQAMNPESLRSTSALDFIFVPLWPSLGAFGGWAVGAFVRALLRDR